MPNNIVLKNSDVCSPATNIYNGYSRLFFFLSKYSIRRSKRFQSKRLHLKTSFSDTTNNILDRSHLPNNHMKHRLQALSVHSYRFLDFTFRVHFVFLWKHMDNLLTREHYQFFHLVFQLFYIFFSDIFIWIFPHNVIRMLQRANMLPCDSYGYFFNRNFG